MMCLLHPVMHQWNWKTLECHRSYLWTHSTSCSGDFDPKSARESCILGCPLSFPNWIYFLPKNKPLFHLVKMGPFMSPFNNLLCMLLGISFTVWFTLLLVFIIVPAIFGLSFGIRSLYMKTLLKVFKVSWGSSCSLSGCCCSDWFICGLAFVYWIA